MEDGIRNEDDMNSCPTFSNYKLAPKASCTERVTDNIADVQSTDDCGIIKMEHESGSTTTMDNKTFCQATESDCVEKPDEALTSIDGAEVSDVRPCDHSPAGLSGDVGSNRPEGTEEIEKDCGGVRKSDPKVIESVLPVVYQETAAIVEAVMPTATVDILESNPEFGTVEVANGSLSIRKGETAHEGSHAEVPSQNRLELFPEKNNECQSAHEIVSLNTVDAIIATTTERTINDAVITELDENPDSGMSPTSTELPAPEKTNEESAMEESNRKNDHTMDFRREVVALQESGFNVLDLNRCATGLECTCITPLLKYCPPQDPPCHNVGDEIVQDGGGVKISTVEIEHDASALDDELNKGVGRPTVVSGVQDQPRAANEQLSTSVYRRGDVLRKVLGYDTDETSSAATSSDSEESESSLDDTSSISCTNNDREVHNDDDEGLSDDEVGSKRRPLKQVQTKGELTLDDLPPIHDLKITVNENDIQHIGHVMTIVDRLVIVQSLTDCPALNIDSVLFVKGGDPLGMIFDVFGPVVRPLYSIRFNTADDIMKKDISSGLPVYYAPRRNEFTALVFAEQLKREKGSDASWQDNNEPPEECLDYSDDEKEKLAKARRKNRERKATNKDEQQPPPQKKRPNRQKLQTNHDTRRSSAGPNKNFAPPQSPSHVAKPLGYRPNVSMGFAPPTPQPLLSFLQHKNAPLNFHASPPLLPRDKCPPPGYSFHPPPNVPPQNSFFNVPRPPGLPYPLSFDLFLRQQAAQRLDTNNSFQFASRPPQVPSQPPSMHRQVPSQQQPLFPSQKVSQPPVPQSHSPQPLSPLLPPPQVSQPSLPPQVLQSAQNFAPFRPVRFSTPPPFAPPISSLFSGPKPSAESRSNAGEDLNSASDTLLPNPFRAAAHGESSSGQHVGSAASNSFGSAEGNGSDSAPIPRFPPLGFVSRK